MPTLHDGKKGPRSLRAGDIKLLPSRKREYARNPSVQQLDERQTRMLLRCTRWHTRQQASETDPRLARSFYDPELTTGQQSKKMKGKKMPVARRGGNP